LNRFKKKNLDIAEHEQAALLHVVAELDEGQTAARIGDQEENLRPPELDVVFARVQEEQVLSDLCNVERKYSL
jgi:hypothetical protein